MVTQRRVLALLNPTASDAMAEPAFRRAWFLAREMGAALELFVSEWTPADGRGPTLAWLQELAASLIKEGIPVSTDVSSDRHAYAAIMRKVANARADIAVKTTRHDNALSRTLFNHTDWHLIRHCRCPLLLAKDECDWETRRIVACVDPAHIHSKAETLDNEIIETAQSLAWRLKGELHIFHSIEDLSTSRIQDTPAQPGFETAARDEHEHLLRELLKPYGCGEGRVHMVAGKPSKTLVPFANEINASLVVMGAVSKGILETLFIGNTAERVLDNLSCDILVVKSRPVEVELADFAYAPV